MSHKIDTIKNQLSFKRVLIDSVILCALFGFIVVGSLYWNPEIWLNDYPLEIQAVAGPISTETKTQQLIIGIPFMLLLLGMPLYSNLKLKKQNGGQLSFWTAFINVFLIFSALNLFDLFVLDLWFVTMTPEAWIIPGTEELMERYNTFAFHAMENMKGLMLSLIFSPIFAFITIRNWRKNIRKVD